MIATLDGIVAEATPLSVVLDVAGVGYDVQVPVTTSERIPPVGQRCKLFIEAIYREDSQALYGFATRSDREVFRLLIHHVTGVGPKVALGAMSRLSADSLRGAIAAGDVRLLSQCPGIGKKTAERMVIELRDKIGSLSPMGAMAPTLAKAGDGTLPLPGSEDSALGSARHDALLALVALGYNAAEADKAIRRAAEALGPKATTEALVKRALSGS